MSIYCKICDIPQKHIRGLAQHISKHKHNSKTYYDTFIKEYNEEKCKTCGNLCNWLSLSKGYNTYCSIKCIPKDGGWNNPNAEERRKQFSKRLLDNPMFGAGKRKGIPNKKPYPIEAIIKRFKMNGFGYKGKFFPIHPEKYEGDVNNIVWRSTWERKFMMWCDKTPEVIKWSSEEIVVPYRDPTQNGKLRRYFPDFKLTIRKPDKTTETRIVEIKPDAQTKKPVKPKKVTKKYIRQVSTYLVNEAKWNAAIEMCKDNNYKFVILTEKHLFPKKHPK